MNDKKNQNSIHGQLKATEDDKYLRVFKHLESVNTRNRAAFDELLRYTYNNIDNTQGFTPDKDKQ